jgi:hypothetical protein
MLRPERRRRRLHFFPVPIRNLEEPQPRLSLQRVQLHLKLPKPFHPSAHLRQPITWHPQFLDLLPRQPLSLRRGRQRLLNPLLRRPRLHLHPQHGKLPQRIHPRHPPQRPHRRVPHPHRPRPNPRHLSIARHRQLPQCPRHLRIPQRRAHPAQTPEQIHVRIANHMRQVPLVLGKGVHMCLSRPIRQLKPPEYQDLELNARAERFRNLQPATRRRRTGSSLRVCKDRDPLSTALLFHALQIRQQLVRPDFSALNHQRRLNTQ